MDIKAYFWDPNMCSRAFAEIVADGAIGLDLRYFSREEPKLAGAQSVKEPEFSDLLSSGTGGFFAFGQTADSYVRMVDCPSNPINRGVHVMCPMLNFVRIPILKGEQLLRVFSILARFECVFACACLGEEWNHRHKIIRRFATGTSIEQALGVDMRYHVPGLYWRTLLDRRFCEARCVDLTMLAQFPSKEIGSEHILYEPFDSPTDWTQFFDHIESTLDSIPGFFHGKEARRILSNANTYREFRHTVDEIEGSPAADTLGD